MNITSAASAGGSANLDSLGVRVLQLERQQQEVTAQQAVKLIEESSPASGAQPARPDPSTRVGLNVDVHV
ncbi:hypothetical protein [Balneatrix alpica]|uniref:Motility protein n=1 Tax=Balneatrix alpica TaxID=75684 RepID=A0ABV5ZHN4_9GAMM|nr:hypothetical protein [Balneatrix alpica]